MKTFLLVAIFCVPLLAQQPAAPASPAPAAESPVPSDTRWLTGSLDLGYRWVTGTGGSFATYRSVVDLGSGPKLLGADFTLTDPQRRLFDRVDVRASDWGGDPYSTFHLDAKKSKLYDFSADYRNIAYYNNLPSFADPLLATSGVILNEQSLDTRQRLASFQLDLLPGGRIVPWLAYERNADSGRGVATFVSDGNEFPVFSRIRNSTSNYRGGVRVELFRFHLLLEQGGTTFKDDQQLSQSPGQTNPGNFTSPLLGQTLDLTGLGQAYGIRGTSIYSKASLTSNVTSWLDLYGQFLYSQPDSNVNFQQFSTGNQVLLNQVLFYTGEQSIVSAEAKLPHTSGSFGAEIRPFRRLRVLPSWLTDRMHTNSSASSSQILMTAAGPVPLNALLNSALVTNYSQADLSLMFDLTPKLTLRGGYRYVWGDASDVILPVSGLAGLDRGRIRRHVALAGFAWRPLPKLSVHTDFEDGSSGSTYFRTSLYNYRKARVRGRYQLSTSLSLSANASVLSNQNPTPGIRYDFLSHQESAALFYTPSGGRTWDFEGAYTRSTLRSDISYLDPGYLITSQSFYRDNSHTLTALFDLNMPDWLRYKTKLTLGGSAFLSSGSNPTRFYQPVAKLAVTLTKNVAWVSEWRYYGFDESFYLYQNFRTHTVTTGVRISR
ncbi:MAG: hypothetical protein ABUS49_12510 [Acidobacteriota bacterium]